MQQRCPRCRTNERKLLRFGVYLCPACGETDADGIVLAPPAPRVRVGEPMPAAPERPSAPAFAAPPPPTWTPPGAPVAPPKDEGSGPPRILVATISVLVLLDLVGAGGARNACTAITHLADVGFLLAVLSGKSWARAFGFFSAGLEVLVAIFALALAGRVPDAGLALFLRVYGGVALTVTAFWVYVMLRADVTAYFVRNARG